MVFQRPLGRVSAVDQVRDRLTVFRLRFTARRKAGPEPPADRETVEGSPCVAPAAHRQTFVTIMRVALAVGVGVVTGLAASSQLRLFDARRTTGASGTTPGQTSSVSPAAAPLAELPLITAAPTSAAPTTTIAIAVHAAGAFVHPGVYVFPTGARVDDLIAAAGGPLTGAQTDVLNLAAPLSDGERVWMPVRGQPVPTVAPVEIAGPAVPPSARVAASGSGAPFAGRLDTPVFDLNLVTAEQLDSLPGVGPATAAAIIEYRTEHQRFRSVGELLNVRGIGEAKLSALRNRVRV
jgi:competence protein ComEA